MKRFEEKFRWRDWTSIARSDVWFDMAMEIVMVMYKMEDYAYAFLAFTPKPEILNQDIKVRNVFSESTMSRRDPGGRYPPPGGPVASLRTRVNGDYSTGSSSSSVARELDDLMRIIESDWMMLTRSNVRKFPFSWTK